GLAGEEDVVQEEIAGAEQEDRDHVVGDGRAEVRRQLLLVDRQQPVHGIAPGSTGGATYCKKMFSSVGCCRSGWCRFHRPATGRAITASRPSVASIWQSTATMPAAPGSDRTSTARTPFNDSSSWRSSSGGAVASRVTRLVWATARCSPLGESMASSRPWSMMATR